MGMKKEKQKLKRKVQNGRLKKPVLFNYANSQYFFGKISGIGPRVSICKLMQEAVAQSIWSSHCTMGRGGVETKLNKGACYFV